MRYLFFICLFLFSTNPYELIAQSGFVFSPESVEQIVEPDEIEPLYWLKGTMENTSDEILEVDWKLVDFDLPNQWFKQVIADNFEYLPSINESVFPVTLEANQSDVRFELLMYPDGQAACVSFKVVFSEHTSGVVLDTVDYLLSINDVSCITTSTSSTIDKSIIIFPNPTNGLVQFTGMEDIREISLYDLNGKILIYKKINNPELDLTHLESGIYILKIHSFNQEHQIFRILKQ